MEKGERRKGEETRQERGDRGREKGETVRSRDWGEREKRKGDTNIRVKKEEQHKNSDSN